MVGTPLRLGEATDGIALWYSAGAVIDFYNEGCAFRLPQPKQIEKWLLAVLSSAGYRLGELTYIFCSDAALLQLNQHHLGHDYLTDVLTFDYSLSTGEISGEVYISVDRVKENGSIYQVSWEEELCLVMVHGILHLMGYRDELPEEQAEMRRQEASALRHVEVKRWLAKRSQQKGAGTSPVGTAQKVKALD